MKTTFDSIVIVGLGYIGLPTAAVFASRKIKVLGVDINRLAVDTINRGQIHIVEPDLDMVVHAAVKEGYLSAAIAPRPADAFLIAVPTPFKSSENGIPVPDLTYVESATRSIASVLKKGDLVILESTSPVGTTEQMSEWLSNERQDLTFPHTHGENSDIRLAHCPERVLPGNVLRELVQNDRVIGGMTNKCSLLAMKLYQVFVRGKCVVTNSRTAEMCKLTENSFRDVNIAFANELSMICDRLKIDVWDLIELANLHPRVRILQPGPGVGGHCIAVDPWFIVSAAPEQAKLIRMAREVNDSKPQWVIDKVKLAVADYLIANPRQCASDIKVVCCGLAFKADIDDLRESPAISIVKELGKQMKGCILAVEPNVRDIPKTLGDIGVQLAKLNDAISMADVLVLLVDHKEFKEINWGEIDKPIIDLRGLSKRIR